jgi:transposase
MSQNLSSTAAVIGIDTGRSTSSAWIHVGQSCCGRSGHVAIEAQLANMPLCLVGMEACVGAYDLRRKLKTFGHDARLMPAKYVRP